MVKQLLLGSLMTLVNLGIQLWAVSLVLSLLRRRGHHRRHHRRAAPDMTALRVIMLFLFLGHILQFATWALLFLALDEFSDFRTAFYHSAVNFTSLGYGDIVMSEEWRLLGPLEAANGVLMFGLTAGLVLPVMINLFRQRPEIEEFLREQRVDDGTER